MKKVEYKPNKIMEVLDHLDTDGIVETTPEEAIDFINWLGGDLDGEETDEIVEDMKAIRTSLSQHKGNKVRLERTEQAPSGLHWVAIEE